MYNADARRYDDRIDALTREMAQIGTEVRVLQAGMNYVQRDVTEIKAALVGLQNRGAQPHWSIIAAGVILAVALAVTLLWYSVPR
jgi:hypothetical protein